MPLISVIVPVYKVEPYLNRCVDSIRGQSFCDFELILIDDGSPDRCGEICDGYAAKDDRIHVIHQENGGLSAARNAGIDWAFSNSDSEWITFIDSDDWVHERYLEILFEVAKRYNQHIVIAECGITSGIAPEVSDKTRAMVYEVETFYAGHPMLANIACGKLFLKSLFSGIRFPRGKIHEDEYVIYKVLFKYKQVGVVHQPLYAYYQNPNGIMKRSWNTQRLDSIMAMEEQIAFFLRYNYLLAAKDRYICLMYRIFESRDCISEASGLSEKEKKQTSERLYKKARELNLKYHNRHWITLRNKGLFFQVYGTVFPPFRAIYFLVSRAKRFIIGIRKQWLTHDNKGKV